MSLVTMRELLQDARKGKYAVGGFNIFNYETLNAVTEVAEELKTPIVLGIPERLFKFVDVDTLSAAMVRAAQKAAVPVALHLDHSHSFEGVLKAIRWGFTSVMFDGSALPLPENLKKTKEITRIARSLGLSVEGELGYVGFCNNDTAPNEENIVSAEVAADFVERTRVDALAVAVGNNHGSYRGNPKLNLPRLNELSSAVNVPLVMHGGSRLNFEDYKSSIQSGISKINVTSDMSLAATEGIKAELAKNAHANYIHLMSVVKKSVKDSVRRYMLAFDCISKAM